MHENIEESAKLILENNRDALIFWGVLIFTCVVGVIELLPEIKPTLSSVQQICLGIIYFALLFGMIFSIRRALAIYRDNRKIALSGELGKKIAKKANKDRTFMDRFIDWPWCTLVEVLAIVFAIVVFGLLYLTKIGVLQ